MESKGLRTTDLYARQRVVLQRSPWRLLALVIFLFVVLYTLASYSRHPARPDSDTHASALALFGIMIDAGSTGSRIHVYRFLQDARGELVLQNELFQQIKPGLSSYKDVPGDAARSLVPLLDAALATVPYDLQRATPINVKATAGLRLLGHTEADAILEAVRDLIRTYPFFYDPEDAVEIMDGQDEGLFGWVTINYLLRALNFRPDLTSVVLDLGGGSTQIAMSVPGTGDHLLPNVIMGTPHNMFLHSFLGYGLMAGRGKVLGHQLSLGDMRRLGQEPLVTSCLPQGAVVKYVYGDDSFDARGAAASSFDTCFGVAIATIKADPKEFSTTLPRPPGGQPIVALSYYFDRAVDAGLVLESVQESSVTPAAYMEAARKVCALPFSEVQQHYSQLDADTAAFLCLDLCFISSLLTEGFGLAPEAKIILAKSMQYNGARVETQWSLGASLAEITETRTMLGL